MNNKLKKPLLLFLGCAVASSFFTACTKDTGAIVAEADSALDDTAIYGSVLDTKSSLNEFFTILDEIELFNEKVNKILEEPEANEPYMQVIAAYKNIVNHGLTIEDVKDNLHYILVFSQVPRGLSDEEFTFAAGKLADTVNCNPFSAYIELAKMIHLYECDELHENNEYGVFSCDALMQEYEDNFREIPIEEYLDQKLAGNTLYEFVREELKKYPEVDMNEVVRELEIMVYYGLMPATDMPIEEWYSNFNFLLGLLTEDETLFEKFIPLAKDVHNAMFPEDELVLSNNVNHLERLRK